MFLYLQNIFGFFEKIEIIVPLFEKTLLEKGKKEEFYDGKQIICLYSIFCNYCKFAAAKLHLLLKNNNLSVENIKVIFWDGTPDVEIIEFFSEQNIYLPEYTTFPAETFLTITKGKMPVFLFSDNGTIVFKADYITLNEKEVINFFQK